MWRNGENRDLAPLRTEDPKDSVGAGRVVFNISLKDRGRGVERIFNPVINVSIEPRMTRIYFQKAKRLFNLRQFLRRKRVVMILRRVSEMKLEGGRHSNIYWGFANPSRLEIGQPALNRGLRLRREIKPVV